MQGLHADHFIELHFLKEPSGLPLIFYGYRYFGECGVGTLSSEVPQEIFDSESPVTARDPDSIRN